MTARWGKYAGEIRPSRSISFDVVSCIRPSVKYSLIDFEYSSFSCGSLADIRSRHSKLFTAMSRDRPIGGSYKKRKEERVLKRPFSSRRWVSMKNCSLQCFPVDNGFGSSIGSTDRKIRGPMPDVACKDVTVMFRGGVFENFPERIQPKCVLWANLLDQYVRHS